MKCPLLAIAWGGVPYAYPDCIQEACAWWDDVTKECAILRIAHSVNVISGELHQAGKAGK